MNVSVGIVLVLSNLLLHLCSLGVGVHADDINTLEMEEGEVEVEIMDLESLRESIVTKLQAERFDKEQQDKKTRVSPTFQRLVDSIDNSVDKSQKAQKLLDELKKRDECDINVIKSLTKDGIDFIRKDKVWPIAEKAIWREIPNLVMDVIDKFAVQIDDKMAFELFRSAVESSNDGMVNTVLGALFKSCELTQLTKDRMLFRLVLTSKSEDAFDLLIQNGAQINVKGNERHRGRHSEDVSPLAEAIRHQNLVMAKKLLQNGADVDVLYFADPHETMSIQENEENQRSVGDFVLTEHRIINMTLQKFKNMLSLQAEATERDMKGRIMIQQQKNPSYIGPTLREVHDLILKKEFYDEIISLIKIK